jgi:hypothetical protein
VHPLGIAIAHRENTYQRLVGVLFVWTPATHLDSVKDMLAVHFLAKVADETRMGHGLDALMKETRQK